LTARREVDGRREDVVRGLPQVDVVVRADVVAGERRDRLVRVHVRGGPRAGLQGVARILGGGLAGRDALRLRGDALRLRRRAAPPRGTDRSQAAYESAQARTRPPAASTPATAATIGTMAPLPPPPGRGAGTATPEAAVR